MQNTKSEGKTKLRFTLTAWGVFVCAPVETKYRNVPEENQEDAAEVLRLGRRVTVQQDSSTPHSEQNYNGLVQIKAYKHATFSLSQRPDVRCATVAMERISMATASDGSTKC